MNQMNDLEDANTGNKTQSVFGSTGNDPLLKNSNPS